MMRERDPTNPREVRPESARREKVLETRVSFTPRVCARVREIRWHPEFLCGPSCCCRFVLGIPVSPRRATRYTENAPRLETRYTTRRACRAATEDAEDASNDTWSLMLLMIHGIVARSVIVVSVRIGVSRAPFSKEFRDEFAARKMRLELSSRFLRPATLNHPPVTSIHSIFVIRSF